MASMAGFAQVVYSCGQRELLAAVTEGRSIRLAKWEKQSQDELRWVVTIGAGSYRRRIRQQGGSRLDNGQSERRVCLCQGFRLQTPDGRDGFWMVLYSIPSRALAGPWHVGTRGSRVNARRVGGDQGAFLLCCLVTYVLTP